MSREEQRRILHNLDRIEDRLRDAPEGLHEVGPPADRRLLAESGLDPDLASLWAAFDGIDFGSGEARVYPIAEQADATAAAAADGRLRDGDRVIGERGRDLFVLAGDPHAEGADVILVEEDGERAPHSSSVDRLILALLGECSVLFDEDGEYQPDLFADDGQLSPAAERRMLRRHLDFDPDAPLARFRLAQSLRRTGELRAAGAELKQLLRRAPEFVWAHLELGRVRLGEQRAREAEGAFRRAADLAPDPGLRAHCLAWACLALQTGPEAQDHKASQQALAAVALAASPSFPAAQEAAVRDALANDDAAAADEQLALGLAVAPAHLGLLSLRPAVAELRERIAAAAPEPEEEVDHDADVDPALRNDDAERFAHKLAAKQPAREPDAPQRRAGAPAARPRAGDGRSGKQPRADASRPHSKSSRGARGR
jgi:tetratricopeptide (TPR) repeat protein